MTRYANRWAECWPHTVTSTRHVEVLADRGAWRAEALDKRIRIDEALQYHQADDNGRCPTCQQPAPCLTAYALTTRTIWARIAQAEPRTQTLTPDDIKAAVAELAREAATTAGNPPRREAS
ncbi:hypothetical protein ACLGIH_20335 [Streptomyces sp. HMX87]|uniref:hypothetical protein n=1 Tax=Streptomyces sp. HMX87 TaxID=3390849 RepID=UPI003A8AF07E